MELNMSMKQTQTLSPQMMQSMEILQMGSQELLEYIENQVQENPVLEMEEKYTGKDEGVDLQRKLEWLESTDAQNRVYHQQDSEDDGTDPVSNYGNADETEENLYLYVLSQLELLDLEPELLEAGRFLVESLNQNGWLDEPLEALAAGHGCGPEVMAQALEVVQSLEPAGVGARDLAECLKLQLVRRTPVNELAVRIVERHLDALSKSRYGLIARELKASPEEVRAACDVIRSLNPRPGTGFAARENLTYINPDIIVVSFPDHFELLTNDYYFPTLNISGYYTRLMKESDDSQVKDYLTGKVRQAKWMVKAIEQRRSTLMACAECILEFQEPFFRKGPGHLVPLSLADDGIRASLGWLFTWKSCILLGIVVLSVFFYRPFCKWLCPLGAFYGLCNKVSVYRLEVDQNKCTSCGACSRVCQMDVDVFRTPNHAECIRCGDCVATCPHQAIAKTFSLKKQAKKKETV